MILKEVVAAFFFHLFDEFFDITGDFVSSCHEECIVRIDDDQVFHADGSDETFVTMNEQIFAPDVEVVGMNDRIVSGFVCEKFVQSLPVTDIAPLECRWNDETRFWRQFFDDEWLNWLALCLGIKCGECFGIKRLVFLCCADLVHDVVERRCESLGPCGKCLNGKNKVTSIPQIIETAQILFGSLAIWLFFESGNRENSLASDGFKLLTHAYIPESGIGPVGVDSDGYKLVRMRGNGGECRTNSSLEFIGIFDGMIGGDGGNNSLGIEGGNHRGDECYGGSSVAGLWFYNDIILAYLWDYFVY